MPGTGIHSTWEKYLKNKKDMKVRDVLVMAYYFLVEAESKRLLSRLPTRAYWEKREDIGSAGVIGLLLALDNFIPPLKRRKDPGRAFEAYARYRIRGRMIDELRSLDFARRNLRKKAREIQEAERKLEIRFGRTPEDVEVAKALGVNLETFYEWVSEINMLNLLSLDAQITDGLNMGGTWADLLEDQKAENPLDKVEKQEKINQITIGLKKLNDSEQKVLQLYYVENITFKEIGTVLRVSESRVCQIHHMAIFRLQGVVIGDGREKIRTELR